MDVTLLRTSHSDAATVIYAVGDIHGRLDLLDRMEALIAADIRDTAAVRPLVCYLGDYIDRGPNSAQVLERLCEPFADDVARIFLKGNHEDRMIDFLQDPVGCGPSWLKFGGREALASYGIAQLVEHEESNWERLRDELNEVLPDSHRRFLNALHLGLMWHGYLLVHAGLNPDRPVHDQRPRDIMWIREPFLTTDCAWGFRVVHGHVISEEPVFRANRIGIDTGAYRTGRLTCLVISAEGTRIMQTY